MLRCSKCKKILRPRNKSGFCNYHNTRNNHIEHKRKKCFICKEDCSGKMLIEIRKNHRKSFCTRHFNKLNNFDKMSDIKNEIRRMKSYH